MRHNAAGRKLGRKTPHRLAMFRNQLASLVSQERIVTTISKAKELRPLAEKVVSQGKRGTVHARRLVGRWLLNRDLIQKLFDDIAPRFESRPGGYLRIVKLGARQGDGAEMAILEFVDFQLKKKVAPPVESKEKKAKGEAGSGEAGEGNAAKPKKEKATKAPAAKKSAGEKKSSAKAGPKAKTTKSLVAPKKTSAPKKVGGG